MKLKYGMNPYQSNAEIDINDSLQILNGNPSYINFLDALNSWQLVKELENATKKPASTSFKHVSPSGAAVYNDFILNELKSYNYNNKPEAAQTSAYLKARGSDRLASFGDFIAISNKVEVELAKLIKSEVSDGIIAPDYSDEALEIIKTKKKGNYCILKINKAYTPPKNETREIFGFRLKQDRNDIQITSDSLKNIRTGEESITENTTMSIVASLITLKYTQSNSISVAYNGHVIGVGAGQQSRILCSELALSKANKWYQKTKLKYDEIKYPSDFKHTKTNKDLFHDKIRELNFGSEPVLSELNDLCLCSDAFFPQTDNIELAHKFGIRFIAAPMGSIRDNEIIEMCNKLGITFIELDFRLFHH